MERERALFRERHPTEPDAVRSGPRFPPLRRADELDGSLARGPPGVREEAEGARFTDVDGNVFVDFCLGDTGGMAGHAPKASVDAIVNRRRGASR